MNKAPLKGLFCWGLHYRIYKPPAQRPKRRAVTKILRPEWGFWTAWGRNEAPGGNRTSTLPARKGRPVTCQGARCHMKSLSQHQHRARSRATRPAPGHQLRQRRARSRATRAAPQVFPCGEGVGGPPAATPAPGECHQLQRHQGTSNASAWRVATSSDSAGQPAPGPGQIAGHQGSAQGVPVW